MRQELHTCCHLNLRGLLFYLKGCKDLSRRNYVNEKDLTHTN